MPNVEILCVQCKENFVFSELEQEKFYARNMMTPQRCGSCRSKKKSPKKKKTNKDGRYQMVCDHCGKPDSVPFQPKAGRSILCRDCFQASRVRVKSAK